MTWTGDERASLLDHYWSEHSPPTCPNCQRNLHVTFRSDAASYLLDVRCPGGCDAAIIGSHEDRLREQFRAWTEDERQRVIRHHLRDTTPTCPVCGTGIFVSVSPTRGGARLACHCGRCLNHAETIAKRA